MRFQELLLSNSGAGEEPWESLEEQEIKPVNAKGNQPWIFIGGTDAEAPILKAIWCEELTYRKRPYAGKDWR